MKFRHAAALALVGWYLMTPPSRRDPLPHMTQPGRTYHDGARGAAGRLGSTSINPLGVPKLMASNVEPPGIVSHLPKRVEDRHFTYKVSSSRVHASVARELTKILRRMPRKQRVYTGLRVAVPALLTRGIVREFPIVDFLSIVRASRSADDHWLSFHLPLNAQDGAAMKEQQRKKNLLWIIILASAVVFVEFRYADLPVAIMLLIVDAIAIGILYVYRTGNGDTKVKPL